ncbi:MAG: FecR family protein [Treponema sp.]|jgi:hypothetical protein|nr:FecR family protein [Treponema sp.]
MSSSAATRVIPRATEYRKPSPLYDILAVLVCLSIAAGGFYLFYKSLFQSLGSQSDPVGVVVIKINSVQRRMGNRVLWDRLFTQSPVYDGDLIRVPENSSAVLVFTDNEIELTENTLIRIQLKDGNPQIELASGSINLNTGAEGGNISLVIEGRTIDAAPGTVLSAAAGDEGMTLQVSEGRAVLTTEHGENREAEAGTLLSLNTEGVERQEPAAAVIRPKPNANYLKAGQEKLEIAFSWNRINLERDEVVYLQIARERGFNSFVYNAAAFDNAGVALDTGLWHWRLVFENTVLNSGRFTVTEAVGPSLINPAMNSLFRYSTQPPQVLFQWTEIEGASSYLFQAASSPDFSSMQIERQVWGTSFTDDANIGQGVWYWRVRPIFTSSFEGTAGVSSTAIFRLEQTAALQAPVLKLPAAEDILNISPNRNDLFFSWDKSTEANTYTIRISADQNMQNPVVNETVRNNYYVYGKNEQLLNPGLYYWSVFFIDREGNISPISGVRSFIAHREDPPEAAPAVIAQERVTETPQIRREPVSILLGSPAHEASLPGLTALREQTVFSWSSNGEVRRSRFVLSRNSNPLQGTPFMEIVNPPQTIRVDRLEEGLWYWTIEAEAADGNNINAASVRQLRVQPIPLLASPQNMQPARGSRFGTQQLAAQTGIVFSWSAVPGANGYIITLLHETTAGRRQITRSNLENRLNWTLTNFAILERGTIVWQIEAVTRNPDGVIEQRGQVGENSFIIDIPVPGPVQLIDTGNLYGN